MRVLLIHNPSAGDADHDGEDIRAALARRGDDVKLISKKDRDLESALRGSDAELFAVAGGDGTVAKVVRAIVGHRDVPLHIIPTGTANNIAGSLGIEKRELDLDVVRRKWVTRAADVATVDEEIIVEAAGCGVLPAFMRMESGGDRAGTRQEAKRMAERVASSPLFDYRIVIGDTEIAGEALLIEAMVIRQIGPSLILAPDADPGDGLLDVVIAGEEHREKLLRYLKRGGKGELSMTVHRAASVTIACDAPWHLDDEAVGRGARTIAIRHAAWRALVPMR